MCLQLPRKVIGHLPPPGLTQSTQSSRAESGKAEPSVCTSPSPRLLQVRGSLVGRPNPPATSEAPTAPGAGRGPKRRGPEAEVQAETASAFSEASEALRFPRSRRFSSRSLRKRPGETTEDDDGTKVLSFAGGPRVQCGDDDDDDADDRHHRESWRRF